MKLLYYRLNNARLLRKWARQDKRNEIDSLNVMFLTTYVDEAMLHRDAVKAWDGRTWS